MLHRDACQSNDLYFVQLEISTVIKKVCQNITRRELFFYLSHGNHKSVKPRSSLTFPVLAGGKLSLWAVGSDSGVDIIVPVVIKIEVTANHLE
jgi:hypothetical protein